MTMGQCIDRYIMCDICTTRTHYWNDKKERAMTFKEVIEQSEKDSWTLLDVDYRDERLPDTYDVCPDCSKRG